MKIETQIWTLSNTDCTDSNRFFAIASIPISNSLTALRLILRIDETFAGFRKNLMLSTSDFSTPTDPWVLTQGLFTAPSERPVLSQQARTGFEPQRGGLMKIETQIWTLSNTDSTDSHRFFDIASIPISNSLTALRRIFTD
jgi:hypothetical protein